MSDLSKMRTFWKILSIVLLATCFVSFLLDFSMYWWPDIPSSPRPTEGRIYPLNNHAHYTYMNRPEYVLDRTISWVWPALLVGFAAIQHFVDPFEMKRRLRPLRRPRP